VDNSAVKIRSQRDEWQTKLLETLHDLRMRPNTGRFWLDFLYVLAIVLLQQGILPSVFGNRIYFDLLTPWLVVSSVRQSLFTSTFLAMVAALALESRSAVPAGMYICAYWILVNAVHFVRELFSWRHSVPWLFTFAIAGTWIAGFETFILLVVRGWRYFEFPWIGIQLVRVLIVVAFGMLLSLPWIRGEQIAPNDGGMAL